MKRLSDVKFSTLDLVPVRENGSAAQSLHNSLDLAQHVEKLGYNRFWVAEHHNMDGIASSATSFWFYGFPERIIYKLKKVIDFKNA